VLPHPGHDALHPRSRRRLPSQLAGPVKRACRTHPGGFAQRRHQTAASQKNAPRGLGRVTTAAVESCLLYRQADRSESGPVPSLPRGWAFALDPANDGRVGLGSPRALSNSNALSSARGMGRSGPREFLGGKQDRPGTSRRPARRQSRIGKGEPQPPDNTPYHADHADSHDKCTVGPDPYRNNSRPQQTQRHR
jgi:hypothetical protein